MQLFPLLERATRLSLTRRGVHARLLQTSVGGVHLYDAPGSGALPPVVLVHGFGAAGSTFAPLLEALRPHVSRVLMPELPGHGLSGPSAHPLSPEVVYRGVLEALDRTLNPHAPVLLFGNSLGGAVAMRLAVERAAQIRGLFLASPAGAPMSDREFAGVRAIFNPRDNAEARSFFTRAYVKPVWFYPALAPALRTHFSQRPLQQFLTLAEKTDWLSGETLKGLTMPVRLSWGARDQILPASLLGFYRAHMPSHVVFEEPHDEGHCPHVDDPRKLADRLVRFARELAPQS